VGRGHERPDVGGAKFGSVALAPDDVDRTHGGKYSGKP
jgi:hypothetical protein